MIRQAAARRLRRVWAVCLTSSTLAGLLLSEPVEACTSVPGFERGQVVTLLCEERLPEAWTALNLADDWVPRILSEDTGPPQPYRERFIALANERLGAGREWSSAQRDAHFELFGIFPSFSVIRARFADEERHACHARVADTPLREWHASAAASAEPRATPRAALAAVRAHLACERLLPERARNTGLDAALRAALAVYQRRHMLPSLPELDAETREALLTQSLELDFRTLLRALRERVVDGTGLIEDGSARNDWQPILGRRIDSAEYQRALRSAPLPGALPDLVALATEVAASALGWTSPERAAVALRAEVPSRAAVELPPLPAHHGPRMVLRAEIARGDARPATGAALHGALAPSPRPALTLLAVTPDGDVPLVRWPTTLGGWKRERLPGGRETLRYKASPGGRFQWRELLAAPTWFPPPTTPDHELLSPAPGGGWTADTDAVGPGYRSAYGLMALLQHRSAPGTDGSTRLIDTKIRTHGSGNFRSVLRGSSHGCHRLFNHLAVRLGGFLLHHVPNVRHGQLEERYSRVLHRAGERFVLKAQGRGYRFELLEPVTVDVFSVPSPPVAGAPPLAEVDALEGDSPC